MSATRWSRAAAGYITVFARPACAHCGQRMSEEDGETVELFIHALP
jgi:transposase-like protein